MNKIYFNPQLNFLMKDNDYCICKSCGKAGLEFDIIDEYFIEKKKVNDAISDTITYFAYSSDSITFADKLKQILGDEK